MELVAGGGRGGMRGRGSLRGASGRGRARGPPAAAAAAAAPSGTVVALEGVTLQRGAEDLLVGATLRVRPGAKLGLVGPNGAGKVRARGRAGTWGPRTDRETETEQSSLLQALVAADRAEGVAAGRVALAVGPNDVGYLAQTGVGGSDRTVFEEVTAQMAALQRAEAELERLQARVAAGGEAGASAAEMDALVRAADRVEAEGGLAVEARVAKVLRGLGFTREDETRKCAEFSGGWQVSGTRPPRREGPRTDSE